MKTKLIQIQVPIQFHEKLSRLATIDRRSMSAEALVILESEVNRRLDLFNSVEQNKTQIDMEAFR